MREGLRLLASLLYAACAQACNLPDNQPASPQTPDPMTVEGEVAEIDLEPMAEDGNGSLLLRLRGGKEMRVYIPACEGPCNRDAVDVLLSLKAGEYVSAVGERDERGASVYRAQHSLKRVPRP